MLFVWLTLVLYICVSKFAVFYFRNQLANEAQLLAAPSINRKIPPRVCSKEPSASKNKFRLPKYLNPTGQRYFPNIPIYETDHKSYNSCFYLPIHNNYWCHKQKAFNWNKYVIIRSLLTQSLQLIQYINYLKLCTHVLLQCTTHSS